MLYLAGVDSVNIITWAGRKGKRGENGEWRGKRSRAIAFEMYLVKSVILSDRRERRIYIVTFVTSTQTM